MSMTESEALEILTRDDEEMRKGFFCINDFFAIEVAKKVLEEIQQYRAIGTVSEFRELKEKATAIKSDGFSDHLLNTGYTKGYKDGYAKAIDEFSERCKELVKQGELYDYVRWCNWNNSACKWFDRVAEQLKGE